MCTTTQLIDALIAFLIVSCQLELKRSLQALHTNRSSLRQQIYQTTPASNAIFG